MGRKVWVEIVCDDCGSVDYYPHGYTDTEARVRGWVITRDKKYFCDVDCREEYKEKRGES